MLTTYGERCHHRLLLAGLTVCTVCGGPHRRDEQDQEGEDEPNRMLRVSRKRLNNVHERTRIPLETNAKFTGLAA